MKTCLAAAVLCTFLFAGCASNQKETAKPIHQRPWVGGKFETVPTPRAIRTQSSPVIGKEAPLVMAAPEGTPLHRAGLEEGDLILAIDGRRVRSTREVHKAVEKAAQKGGSAATFTLYREGKILEKTVTPGTERFQHVGMVTFGLRFSSHLSFDLWPNPDFSLVALGYDENHERLDLRDPKSRYLRGLQAEGGPEQVDGAGLRSEEGWEFWLGPFGLQKRKTIVAQE